MLKERASATRIGSVRLWVEQAKKRTGMPMYADLIAVTLANVALEDDSAEAFKDARGKVDASLKLGF